jgi:hypothetical protein
MATQTNWKTVVLALLLVGAAKVSTAQKNDLLRVFSSNTGSSIGFSIGTKSAIGVDWTVQWQRNLNVRLGYNYLNLYRDGYEKSLDNLNNDLLLDGYVNLSALELLVERSFWKRRIRVVGGLAFHLKNELGLKIKLSDSTIINDLQVSPDEIGFVRGLVEWHHNPSLYLGLRLGRAIPKNTINVSADLGFYYKGAPSFRIEATNLLKSNVRNEELIEERIKSMRWYPVINVRLGIRLAQ